MPSIAGYGGNIGPISRPFNDWSPTVALRQPLAPYACDATKSRGRLYAVAPSPTRSEFQRDRDRIIHSTAFRRLAHKTQVFVPLDGDHFRTRLTHTIEVGQIARAIARALRVDEDLAEAVALAHDLGHTPFGHAGEEALEACMKPYGGFDHNSQALRVVTLLERRYADYDGLDLTWEALEGIVKHNGPLAGTKALKPPSRYICEFDAGYPLELSSFAGVEAQAAALADDIAYIGHDMDDGLRANLFTLDDIAGATPFVAGLLEEIARKHPGLERGRVIHELVRRVITRFVEDAIGTAQARLEQHSPRSAEEVRGAGEAMVALSAAMREAERDIKRFLFANMYRHELIMRVWTRAEEAISRLFPAFFEQPSRMPAEWATQAAARDGAARAVVVADYIAGMTDRYALGEVKRLFG
ncbi:deoxyguanosinetriphosphate triphosphohydrolase [Methylocystis sp. MJC1]|jgi:dGTPase|uniref:deoxyguanosinetriphosphate triphosphohydrolase n=1 Tax=Methylocystis sp. MJC1 TaxID=2654282 RepID=UPI0013EBB99B|nr:deoxyguanosinetriphosphate triphosphohydrolase [Methylocystis sp. MJC1]KAF2992825.1 Deoxyguanosinetriphosphate triphosphohydrolase-like protein [Methylocystis sp. MJC1]MBU6526784.1 deoxyguanosinetriphosphate triphosphohydrolase [Methylocystis sp. MJC1]UZX13218.1 deoxyguanosinetriphosphate triphosphohydrolase [Methylocystis sp. MJC1]